VESALPQIKETGQDLLQNQTNVLLLAESPWAQQRLELAPKAQQRLKLGRKPKNMEAIVPKSTWLQRRDTPQSAQTNRWLLPLNWHPKKQMAKP
jgi:hypothetical protein